MKKNGKNNYSSTLNNPYGTQFARLGDFWVKENRFMSIACFLGFHTWLDDHYEGLYGGTVIGYKRAYCNKSIPHWSSKVKRLGGLRSILCGG